MKFYVQDIFVYDFNIKIKNKWNLNGAFLCEDTQENFCIL